MAILSDRYPFVISKSFYKILLKMRDPISYALIKSFKNKELFSETFIDVTENDDKVTFISSDSVNKLIGDNNFNKNNIWVDSRRVETRIGRLIHRIFGDNFSSSEIEKFSNNYKSLIVYKKLKKNFKIIEGEDLKKWYLSENYSVADGGTLRQSCMRYPYAQEYFDIYTKNPDKIKLLILMDEDKTHILGRSLIWYLDYPKNAILMDRIYYSENYIFDVFVNHAIDMGWHYKSNNNTLLSCYFDKVIISMRMIIRLKKIKYMKFPFVDSLAFFDPKRCILTNDFKYLKELGCTEYYDLCDTLGEYRLRNDFKYS